MFILNHSSGRVPYIVSNFRDKNMERLSDKLRTTLVSSANTMIFQIFDADRAEEESKFTCAQFKASIQSLLSTLNDARPYFIRCIKPNASKLPQAYVSQIVLTQLTSLSVLDALLLAQKGYPFRSKYETFLKNMHYLRMVLQPSGESPEQESLDLVRRSRTSRIASSSRGLRCSS